MAASGALNWREHERPAEEQVVDADGGDAVSGGRGCEEVVLGCVAVLLVLCGAWLEPAHTDAFEAA